MSHPTRSEARAVNKRRPSRREARESMRAGLQRMAPGGLGVSWWLRALIVTAFVLSRLRLIPKAGQRWLGRHLARAAVKQHYTRILGLSPSWDDVPPHLRPSPVSMPRVPGTMTADARSVTARRVRLNRRQRRAAAAKARQGSGS